MITVVAPSLGLYTSPLWIFLLYFAIMNLSSVLRSEFFFYTSPLGIVVYCTSLCCLWPWPHYSSTLYCPLYSLFVSVFNPLGRSFHVKRITYEGVDVSSRFTKPGLWEILGTLNPKVWGKNEFGVFFRDIFLLYIFLFVFFSITLIVIILASLLLGIASSPSNIYRWYFLESSEREINLRPSKKTCQLSVLEIPIYQASPQWFAAESESYQIEVIKVIEKYCLPYVTQLRTDRSIPYLLSQHVLAH